MNLLSKLFQSFDKAKASTDGDEFEKRPTSAAHWTDAFQRPVSHRAYRRQRERDANRASKKFYANRKEQLRQQLLSDERDAVWLLSAWEKKQGRRWFDDEDDRQKVRDFVGDRPARRGQEHINQKALEKIAAVKAETGHDVTEAPFEADETVAISWEAYRLDRFDRRKAFSATPQQVIDALGITIEDVMPENPWTVEARTHNDGTQVTAR